MRIATPSRGVLGALAALRQTDQGILNSMRKLSTGSKVNRGADDPAALIAGQYLASRIAELEAQQRIADRLDSSATVVDGGLSGVSDMAVELRGALVAAANTAGMTDAERQARQMEVDSLVSGMERVAGQSLDQLDRLNLNDPAIADLASEARSALAGLQALKSGGSSDLSSGDLETALNLADSAASKLASLRGGVGAYQSYTLESGKRSDAVAETELRASRSRIIDTDYAVETSRLNILTVRKTATIKSLQIADAASQSVLDLFK